MDFFKGYVTWAKQNPGKSFLIGTMSFAIAWFATPIAATGATYVWVTEETLKSILIAFGGAGAFTNLVSSAIGAIDKIIAEPLRADNQALRNELQALQNQIQENGRFAGQGFQQIAIDIAILRGELAQRANILNDKQLFQQQRLTTIENGLNERVDNLLALIATNNTGNYSARIQNLENQVDNYNDQNNELAEIKTKFSAIVASEKAIQTLAQEREALLNTISEIQFNQEQDQVQIANLNQRLKTVEHEDQAQAQLIDDLAPTLARLQESQNENSEIITAIDTRLTAIEAESEALSLHRDKLEAALSRLELELQQHTQNTETSYQHIHTLLGQQPVPVTSPTQDLHSEEEPPPVVNERAEETVTPIIDNFGESEDYEIGDDALDPAGLAAEVERQVAARFEAMLQSSSVSSYTSSS